jgi:M6 family metalloprotease-like protein
MHVSGRWLHCIRCAPVLLFAIAAGCGESTGPEAQVPTSLAITASPTAAVAGAAFTVAVAVRDASGALVTNASTAISISLIDPASAGSLGGSKVRGAVNGVATFADLSIDKAAAGYSLSVAAPSLAGATTSTFAVTPAAASSLAFTTQPASGMAGVINGPIAVTLRDAFGNHATQSTAPVTLAITGGSGTAAAALGGTLTKTAVGGVATFADLTVDRAGTAYTLTATANGVTSATSSAFNTGAYLRQIAGWGQVGISGYQLPESVKVKVENPVGAAVAGATVGWSATGGTILSTTTTTNGLGEAYATWKVGQGAMTLTASSGGLSATDFGATGLAPASCTFAGTANSAFPPLPDTRMQPTNRTLRVAALFIDFNDAPATKTVAQMMTQMVVPAKTRLAATSGNRIQLDVVPSANWKRMPEAMANFRVTDFLTHRSYIDSVLARFDAEYDFSTIDFVWIFRPIANDPMLGSGTMNLRIGDFWKLPTRDGRELHNYTTFGGDVHWDGEDHGARIVAHETGHVLLLPDQYAYDTSPTLHGLRFTGGWSFMGLAWPGTAWFAAEQLYVDVLPAVDVLCPPQQAFGAIVTIQPLLSASGLRAIGLRTSATALTFMEVRRKIGMDAGICAEGLLVYDVDGSKEGGRGSIVVREGRASTAGPEMTACELKWNAPYRVGDVFNLGAPDVWIEILSVGGDGSLTVRIKRL